MNRFTYLTNTGPEFLESLWAQYQSDPSSLDPSWRYFFDGLDLGSDQNHTQTSAVSSEPKGETKPRAEVSNGAGVSGLDLSSEAKVMNLILAYRDCGHLIAHLNPLASDFPETHPLLELKNFDLSEQHLDRTFSSGNILGLGTTTLRNIIQRLKQIYCSSIGVEFTHIHDRSEREWIETLLEKVSADFGVNSETRKHILNRLTESETFEQFLGTRYVAQKRFSVEGAESLIPALDCIIETAADLGADNLVMGMAHRGRLNVLANLFKKKPELIFTEFEQNYQLDAAMGEGDVKYHMGYSADFTTRSQKSMHLSLAYNPSHLEVVNPVVEGISACKQQVLGDHSRKRVIPLLIHGDAAFAGQGVIYETLNFSQVNGYKTGGTIHIIIDNQVGFTTDPSQARSTTYSTGIAKMLEAPIFHVNADNPEAVWYVSRIATEYRQKFGKDVFIDLICYRRHGHNESDEPGFSQPTMYKKIKSHATTRTQYAAKLVRDGIYSETETKALTDAEIERLSQAQMRTRTENPQPVFSAFERNWKGFRRSTSEEEMCAPLETGVPEIALKELGRKLNTFPSTFRLHPKLVKLFEARLKAITTGDKIDWGTGEALAYASLLTENYLVRISGQDVGRGTFTHRHAVLKDYESNEAYIPHQHLAQDQAPFLIHNSTLSEMGVLGFEYGWSLADPRSLVIWEAQFGDFSNSAQIVIDQFIASAESKWQRSSGLVMLLPHGYEGQGPEHSSARLERFLQLFGKNNFTVANLTTPAQIFHALRRQMKRDFRKPLIIMSPKSLLRHPAAVSSLDDFVKGRFNEVLDDSKIAAPEKVKRVLFCTGKIFYDLLQERENKRIEDIAIVRLEQICPWPARQLAAVVQRYSNAEELVWVQEEPRNMGAWVFVNNVWSGGFENPFSAQINGRKITYIGRDRGAAPAVGSYKIHTKEQMAIVEQALNLGMENNVVPHQKRSSL